MTTNASELNAVLARYSAASGKNMEQVMRREAVQIAWELWQQFKKLGKTRSQIRTEAIARGWRMGRKSNTLTMAAQGISQSSWRTAVNMMSGAKSDYFKVRGTVGEDAPVFLPVRLSKSKRKTRVLLGKRSGRQFSKGARRWFQTGGTEFEEAIAKSGHASEIKRLNIRALATGIELRRRMLGRNIVALQWLPRVFKHRGQTSKRSAKTMPTVKTMTSNREVVRSINKKDTLGEVEMIQGPQFVSGVALNAYVPGTAKVAARFNVIPKVFRERIRDLMIYITRKEQETANKFGLTFKV